MSQNLLSHTDSAKERADKMFMIVASKKAQYKIINSAPDFCNIQDLFLNSMSEWLHHPKCKIALDSKGKIAF